MSVPNILFITGIALLAGHVLLRKRIYSTVTEEQREALFSLLRL